MNAMYTTGGAIIGAGIVLTTQYPAKMWPTLIIVGIGVVIIANIIEINR